MSTLTLDPPATRAARTGLDRRPGDGPPAGTPEPPDRRPGGGGEAAGDPVPAIGSAPLAMLLFLSSDLMFFAGLIGAFIVFRFGAVDWPPPGQPRLPVEVTGVNTAILLASGVTMLHAWRRLRARDRRGLLGALAWTAILGAVFLAVQGTEWTRLLGFGLTVSSSVYGAIFYTLIGAHGLHVLAAAVWLLAVLALAARAPDPVRIRTALQLCGMYWALVVLLWPLLYALVYLA